MRSESMIARQTAYLDRTRSSGSPPRESVWSTERRLTEKPTPGAPVKANRGARLYLPQLSPFRTTSSTERMVEKALIVPSKTIDEDDECLEVSLPYRPSSTRLTFSLSEEGADPTTVLLGPSTASSGGIQSWHDEGDDAWMEVDNDMSPRLFYRMESDFTLSRYESIEIAEDESDAIFRPVEEEDDDEIRPCILQERFTSSPLQRCKDDVRI